MAETTKPDPPDRIQSVQGSGGDGSRKAHRGSRRKSEGPDGAARHRDLTPVVRGDGLVAADHEGERCKEHEAASVTDDKPQPGLRAERTGVERDAPTEVQVDVRVALTRE